MREDDGRNLDHKTLEQLRLWAVRQIEQGAHPEDVAAGLGMTRAAVYGWLANYREGGLEASRPAPFPDGRQACPAASCSGSTPLWSAMTPGSCSSALPCDPGDGAGADRSGVQRAAVGGERGRLLPKLGLSPQRPLYRADQQNPEAVARGKAETYPSSVGSRAGGATIDFVDEAGVRSDDHAGTTWAPGGHTPVVAAPATGSGSTCSQRSPPRARCGLPPMRAA